VEEDRYAGMLDLAERSGANTVRVDVGWASLQPDGPGRFEPDYAGHVDAFLHLARKRGFQVIVTLLNTPCWASTAPESIAQNCQGRWYDRGVTAYAPAQVNDYANAAREVTRRWGKEIDALEVWNEPNEEFFWKSPDPPGDYGVMLKATYQSVKSVAPHIKVLGGALAYADGDFLQQMYERANILGSYDAISIHPYTVGQLPGAPRRHGTPRKQSYRSGLRWVRRVMERAGDTKGELWLTEVGASTCPRDLHPECFSEADQARYVSEAATIAREQEGVKAFIWYSLTDDGADAAEVVNRYGLAAVDGSRKPSFDAFRQAAAATVRASILEAP
jgi:hypothetical protein